LRLQRTIARNEAQRNDVFSCLPDSGPPEPPDAPTHYEAIMRRYENRSTIMTNNWPMEEWGKPLGDVPTAGAILDRFLHHAQTIAITGRSYRLKDHRHHCRKSG
jgi:DNA replication protein DnaC